MDKQSCIVCKVPLPATLEFFYAHPQMSNGLLSVCKECQKKRSRESELKRKDTHEYKAKAAAKARRLYEKHREARMANSRRWKAANPDKVRAANVKRQQLLRNGTYTAEQWQEKLSGYNEACHWCKQPIENGVIVDHLIPLSRGGKNIIDNVVPSCHPCNQSKHAALPDEFLARRPDLRPLHL